MRRVYDHLGRRYSVLEETDYNLILLDSNKDRVTVSKSNFHSMGFYEC